MSELQEEQGARIDWPDVLVIVAYFIFVLAVGLWVSETRAGSPRDAAGEV